VQDAYVIGIDDTWRSRSMTEWAYALSAGALLLFGLLVMWAWLMWACVRIVDRTGTSRSLSDLVAIIQVFLENATTTKFGRN
jgi:hypothetical protein